MISESNKIYPMVIISQGGGVEKVEAIIIDDRLCIKVGEVEHMLNLKEAEKLMTEIFVVIKDINLAKFRAIRNLKVD